MLTTFDQGKGNCTRAENVNKGRTKLEYDLAWPGHFARLQRDIDGNLEEGVGSTYSARPFLDEMSTHTSINSPR